jgi:hypothetical protein
LSIQNHSRIERPHSTRCGTKQFICPSSLYLAINVAIISATRLKNKGDNISLCLSYFFVWKNLPTSLLTFIPTLPLLTNSFITNTIFHRNLSSLTFVVKRTILLYHMLLQSLISELLHSFFPMKLVNCFMQNHYLFHYIPSWHKCRLWRSDLPTHCTIMWKGNKGCNFLNETQ